MNGRLYDAVLGRFLSPDNYVQDPYNTQSFNRYGYVWNNPLSYNDPSGEFLVSALIGAAIGLITNGINNVINDRPFFHGAGKAALFGAIGGAVSFGIGQITQGISNSLLSSVFQLSAHGLSGGILAQAQGGKFGAGFLSGALSSGISSSVSSVKINNGFWSATVKAASSGLAGGLGSKIADGNFLDGVRQGLTTGLLNHGLHAMWFGMDIHAATVTGKFRHIFGPDAIAVSGSIAAGMGLGFTKGKGALIIKRGYNANSVYEIDDHGVGASTPSASVSVGVTKLYYSGNLKFTNEVFLGDRGELNIGVGAVVSGSISYSYSPVKFSNGNFVYGIGLSLGLGASLTILDINVNLGETKRTRPWKK
ncbi:RHS repeat-associated core domain-containing protein [Flavobacteriaceae bacterium M23B6Z8]